ncbi:MAG: hypothetical protein ACK4FM_02380 [Caldimicrobium sp.]
MMKPKEMKRESWYYFKNLKETMDPFVEKFLKIPSFLEQIKSLKLAILKTNKALEETGSFSFCKNCATKGTICCGEGLEWKLSPEEFFINLCLFKLKEKELYLENPTSETCLFLGQQGCSLELVPLFCRNFFCTPLSQHLGLKNLTYIQQSMEEEAILSFNISEYLKNLMINT